VVGHSPYHPQVKGLCLATNIGTGSEQITKKLYKVAKGGSKVVELLPHHPKGEGLSPVTTTRLGRYKMDLICSAIVAQRPHHPMVKG
jgi:hypothetical protein